MIERDTFLELVADAVVEAGRAMRKFPQPNYVISKVAEEAGEVVKAAIHCAEGRETEENLANEMKQLIAMLYRLWVEGDQVHGLGPVGQNVFFARRYMGQVMAECDCSRGDTCERAGRCLALDEPLEGHGFGLVKPRIEGAPVVGEWPFQEEDPT